MTGPLRKHDVVVYRPAPLFLPNRSGTDPENVALSVWYEYNTYSHPITKVTVDGISFTADEIREFDAN